MEPNPSESLRIIEGVECLKKEPILHCPDYSKQFWLQTDASERGVGAVLSQMGDDGFDHPIAFFSRKLLPREIRYSTTEKECLAIVNAMKHFEFYLLGCRFKVQTDHGALQYLQKMKNSNGRLTRWALHCKNESVYCTLNCPNTHTKNKNSVCIGTKWCAVNTFVFTVWLFSHSILRSYIAPEWHIQMLMDSPDNPGQKKATTSLQKKGRGMLEPHPPTVDHPHS